MKRLVADFDRDFPGIPRTREITALAEEWGRGLARHPLGVMPGHSRSKNGVASLAYGAGHPRLCGVPQPRTWMAGTSPAMTA